MPNTYTIISSVTVGAGGAASMEFTSIPANYTDLSLFISARDTAPGQAADNFKIYFNSANSNRSMKTMLGRPDLGTVQTFGTSSSQTGYSNASTAVASSFGNGLYYIPNYAGATIKAFSGDTVQSDSVTACQFGFDACLWNSTSAITSITIEPNYASQTFVQYSTAYLYGIKNS